jgi:predicted dehydrogenase
MADTLRWGILGTASIASEVAEGIARSSNSIVAAIASRDLARAERWARIYGVPHAFGSYEALLNSGAADVIYNPLPNSLHAEWTIRALRAGLPVLCEKPFTVNAAEAREVVGVSVETGLPVAEAFMYRFHPIYERLFGCLRKGAIGRVTCLHGTFTWFLDDRSQIPASAALAGGALMDVGCYPVNLARLVAGCEPLRACGFQRGAAVDDTLVGLLEFPNGILAQIECSIESSERARAAIVGTRGSIVLESPWDPGDDQARFLLHTEGHEEYVVTPGANRYQLEVEDFARAVLTGSAPRWPAQDAIGNMAAIDALLASTRTGTVMPVGSL